MSTHFEDQGASTTSTPEEKPPTIGDLFAQVTEQISVLVRGEIELTKTKAATMVKKGGAGAALLLVAGVLAFYFLGWAFHTIEVALTYALPGWAAALIVTVIILLVIVILALVGISLLKKGMKAAPSPQEGIKADVDAVKKGLGQ